MSRRFASDAKKRKVLIIGAGRSGLAAATMLLNYAEEIILCDSGIIDVDRPEIKSLFSMGVKFISGSNGENLITDMDLLIISPGVSIYNPVVQSAKRLSIPVWSELELAWRFMNGIVIAITGTNGKTTVTTLLGEIMKADGRHTRIGGNIGVPLATLMDNNTNDTVLVAEISSFQLESSVSFAPHIAVILNITPDHLDRHRSMDEYQQAKEKIFINQSEHDWLILNLDDPLVAKMAQKAHGGVMYFSCRQSVIKGAWLADGGIWLSDKFQQARLLMPLNEIQLKGIHNISNVLASAAAAMVAGVSDIVIRQAIAKFTGVEHRIELVDIINGVEYFNDSKATNPESTCCALKAFAGQLILLAGGRDKNTELTEMMSIVKEKVTTLILFGEAKNRFASAAIAAGVKDIRIVTDIAEAVELAYDTIKEMKIVLLSPACASYDQYDNFEQRGLHFKQLVKALKHKKLEGGV